MDSVVLAGVVPAVPAVGPDGPSAPAVVGPAPYGENPMVSPNPAAEMVGLAGHSLTNRQLFSKGQVRKVGSTQKEPSNLNDM